MHKGGGGYKRIVSKTLLKKIDVTKPAETNRCPTPSPEIDPITLDFQIISVSINSSLPCHFLPTKPESNFTMFNLQTGIEEKGAEGDHVLYLTRRI